MIDDAEIQNTFQLLAAIRTEMDFLLVNENISEEDIFLCLMYVTAEWAVRLNYDKQSVKQAFSGLFKDWEEEEDK